MSKRGCACATAVLWLLAAPAARAQDAAEPAAASAHTTARAAAQGSLLSFAQGAAATPQAAHAVCTGGYDSARRSGMAEANAEVQVWGPLSVRGGAVYGAADGTLRPTFGLRVQLLREARHGVDASAGVFYRPEGLTEAEGEIESVLAAGTHVGRTYLLANLLYGQDPDAHERDGELRLAAVRPVAERLLLGRDSRLRFDLGSDGAKLAAHKEATLDALAGPAATLLVGPVALLAQGGASALRLQGQTRYGAFVLGGVGAAF